MTLLTDEEQEALLDGPSTNKFKRMLSEAEQRILQQVAPIQQLAEKHDEKLREHDGMLSRFLRGFSGIVKG